MNSDLYKILKQYWGYSSFRPLQKDIIDSVLSNKDTLALLPTGGGKSLCFQLPAMAMEGICIVVSPLIALMQDQVKRLNDKGIKAVSVVSGMHMREIDQVLDNCVYGNIKFLYLSPERLKSDLVKERIAKMQVNLIAIDEAHCISQWGYDFRPSYLEIAEIRKIKPKTPVLALTATATKEVVKDIQEKLEFSKKLVFEQSFERKNVAYVVSHTEDKLSKMLSVFKKIKGSGIVYVRSRKKTKNIADFLAKHDITADFYHGGLASELRSIKQESWINNKVRVIVATNAFGMGIDKPDVRTVVHMDVPDTLEAYFQEAGRAGRDQKQAYAVLFYNPTDKLQLQQQFELKYPPLEEVRRVYEAVCNYFRLAVGSGKNAVYDFNLNDFSSAYPFKPIISYNSLKILEREGYLALSEVSVTASRLKFIAASDTLYQFQVKNKKQDEFIKLLLRSYSGLFDDYVQINEATLAKRLEIDKNMILKELNYLHQLELIEYIPLSHNPKITFIEERIDSKNLRISYENYQRLKENSFEKLESVLNYASSTNRCRNRLLLEYFSQRNAKDCLVCDVCKKHKTDEVVFEKIQLKVIEVLTKNPLTLSDLMNEIINKSIKEKDAIEVVQWLVDNGNLIYEENGKLSLSFKI